MNITRFCDSIVFDGGEHDPTSRGRITVVGGGRRKKVAIDYWFSDIRRFERVERIIEASITQDGDGLTITGQAVVAGVPVVVSVLMRPLCPTCGGNQ